MIEAGYHGGLAWGAALDTQWSIGMIKVWGLTSGAIWLCLLAGCDGSTRPSVTGTAQSPVLEVANAIRVVVTDGRNPALGPLASGEREQLTALYGPQADAPLWVDASGRPSRDALALIGGAADEGLDPVDYSAAPLKRLTATLEAIQAAGAGRRGLRHRPEHEYTAVSPALACGPRRSPGDWIPDDRPGRRPRFHGAPQGGTCQPPDRRHRRGGGAALCALSSFARHAGPLPVPCCRPHRGG
jgi:hypothetical protein